MPANATWDDLIYEIYMREVIERRLADSGADKTKDTKQIRTKYGLPERKSNGRKKLKGISPEGCYHRLGIYLYSQPKKHSSFEWGENWCIVAKIIKGR